jgi:hypothetical protein
MVLDVANRHREQPLPAELPVEPALGLGEGAGRLDVTAAGRGD